MHQVPSTIMQPNYMGGRGFQILQDVPNLHSSKSPMPTQPSSKLESCVEEALCVPFWISAFAFFQNGLLSLSGWASPSESREINVICY